MKNGELSIEECLSQFDEISNMLRLDKICEMTPEQLEEYRNLLNAFENVNSTIATTAEKGRALENLVSYLLKISGNLMKVYTNVKTNSNEIDQVIQLNHRGKLLSARNLLPKRFEFFLGECKNHQSKIGVTYVGKFYSLLKTTNITTGILFSYYGVTGGNGWEDAAGLIKKIYLQKEDLERKTIIIDFSLQDFRRILKGDNFFEIVIQKMTTLQLDTSIQVFIAEHPAEDKMKRILDSAQ